ncbi:MAG: GAF domain-containing protein [Planctomycetes bacterium]|nr:GAF domain-containing protein [Planctomycetota bacterium]
MAKAWISYTREGRPVRVPLDKPKTVFGRAGNCDVSLTLKGVSRAHFMIVREDDGWAVNDLSSTNGTYVNEQLTSRKRLEDGDEITLGPPGLVPVPLTFRQSAPEPQPAGRRAVLDDSESDADRSSPQINAAISVEDFSLSVGEPRPGKEPSSILAKLRPGMDAPSDDDSIGTRSVKAVAWLIKLFNEMGNALLRSDNLDEMLQKVLDLSFEHLPAQRGSVWLRDESGGTARTRATRNRGRDDQPMQVSRSIVNEAVRKKQALLVSDTVADVRFSAATSIEQFDIRSAICAPLYHDGKMLGFVYVDTIGEYAGFDQQHLEILTALAVFAAVGVEKWRVQQAADRDRQMRERSRLRIQVLLDVAKSLASELDTTSLVEQIMLRAREILHAERCSLFLLDRERGELYSKVVEGTDDIRFDMRQGIAGYVASSGEALVIDDAYDDPRFNPEIDQKTGFRTRSILCTPLRNKEGDVIGVTQLVNKRGGGFTAEDQEIMGAFSAQAAVALENSMLFQQTLEMRNYLESILQSIDQLVFTLNEHGRLVTCNGDTASLFGREEPWLRDRPYPEWFDGANPEFVENIDRVYAEPKRVYVPDALLQTQGKRTVSVNYHIVPLLDFEHEQKGVVAVVEDITRQKRMITSLNRHLGSEVAQKVLQEEEARLGGVRQNVAILFSDIRGYTALTEAMDAAEVVELLNEYFTLMVDAVFAEQGTLDKYIGDAIMAVFGAPISFPDNSARACRTALHMQDLLAEFNRRRQHQGLAPMGVGIGISSGNVISGYIGSEKRLDYTCIGDGVNVASRLEGLSKSYGVTVVISEYTRDEIGDEFLTRELDLVRVIGKQQPIRIYELLGTKQGDVDPAVLTMLRHFQSGLRAYRAGRWDEALERFVIARDAVGDDEPSQLFAARCRYLRDHPPENGWDGVWAMTHK